ncbi:hypothetical protein C1645_860711 [Glomus cerebriforme]|uniref:HMG box domain-containing protein n=1 Tax=Glomus cerebriforme TaxID=658196 RepID=A0A397TH36_9GLOM|nr:hypothetical protein C1645_860711 [Glomus cerebriforme]
MSTHNFSIDFLASSLLARLERKNIFPPKNTDPTVYLKNLTEKKQKPPNVFFIFRRNVQSESQKRGSFNMRVISKVASILWKNASLEEKADYRKLFERVYEIHFKRISSFTDIPQNATSEETSAEEYQVVYSYPSLYTDIYFSNSQFDNSYQLSDNMTIIPYYYYLYENQWFIEYYSI